MSKDEITSLKEEFLKEIRDLEKRINLQLSLNLKGLTEKNEKFIQEFNQISKNNKSLTDLISSKNFESHKINELEIFKKKTETMVISHDIKLNSAIKEINDIKYLHAKEVSENLTVPGFVGQACKYKNIASYIAVNIKEMDKVKNDTESNKKESKELKRKLEDMIKTLLNLVDKSNEKSIEYVNNKMKHSEEMTNNKIAEVNDKIFNFRTVLLTQDKIDDFKKKIFDEINENNYNKREVDNLINNTKNNFETSLNNLKTELKQEMNKAIKSRIEKYENEIKELNKSLKEANKKIISLNHFQSKLFKDFLDLKNLGNKNNNNISHIKEKENNILDFNFNINKNLFGTSRGLNRAKTNLGKSFKKEEEKAGKNQLFHSIERNKTLDSDGTTKYKSSKKIHVKDLKRYTNYKEKDINNEINLNEEINNEKIKEKINNNITHKNSTEFNENIKSELLNNDSSLLDKEKNMYSNNEEYKSNISMDNKNDISYNIFNDINDENIDTIENITEGKKILVTGDKKVKFRMNNNNDLNEIEFNSDIIITKKEKEKGKAKEKELLIENNPINIPLSKSNSILKKDYQKSVKKNKNIDFSNLISYGVHSNNKVSITPIEKIPKKEETNSILQIFRDTNSSIKTSINNIASLNKTLKKIGGGYSLHRLAAMGVEEKLFDTFPSFHNSGRISDKSSNLVKPFKNRNSGLYQSYDSKLDNDNKNNKKITSAFGRTSYSVYNKKDEGIQNLINRRINSNINKRYKKSSGDFNLELSPVARIKIYEK